MWLLTADNGDITLLFASREDLWKYLDMDRTKQYSIQWISTWAPPPPRENKSDVQYLEELVPLSRAKE